MSLSRIKKEFHDKVIAFGNGAQPLGKRNDLDQLATIAHESGNKKLIELFEHLPTLAELKKQNTDAALEPIRKAATRTRTSKTVQKPEADK